MWANRALRTDSCRVRRSAVSRWHSSPAVPVVRGEMKLSASLPAHRLRTLRFGHGRRVSTPAMSFRGEPVVSLPSIPAKPLVTLCSVATPARRVRADRNLSWPSRSFLPNVRLRTSATRDAATPAVVISSRHLLPDTTCVSAPSGRFVSCRISTDVVARTGSHGFLPICYELSVSVTLHRLLPTATFVTLHLGTFRFGADRCGSCLACPEPSLGRLSQRFAS